MKIGIASSPMRKINSILQGRIQAVWKIGIPVWAPKLGRPNNTFQVLFFKLYFNKIFVEVAISEFTMHLVISKIRLEGKNADRRDKQWDKKKLKRKKKLSTSVFIYLKRKRS